MWQRALGAWRADPDACLLLANDAALAHVVAHAGVALDDARIMTMGQITTRVREEQRLPPVGPDIEMQFAVGAALADPADALGLPPALRALSTSPSGIAALVAHLTDLDERAGADHVPHGEIEEGVWRLRAHLLREGHAAASLRATVSRGAREIALGRRVIAPLTRFSRYHGMLLSALSQHQPVDCHLLASPATADAAVRRIFAADPVQVHADWTGTHRAGSLFVIGAPTTRPALALAEVDDEIDAAMATLAGWIGEGVAPEECALVTMADPDLLERAAAGWAVPLRLWRNVGVLDTPLGATLLGVATTSLRNDQARAELMARVTHPLSDEDLVAVQRARDDGAHQELAALVALGDRIIAGLDIDEPANVRAIQWCDSLDRTRQMLQQRDVAIPRVEDVLRDVVAPPRQWGQEHGVTVLGWGELGTAPARRVVYTGLAEYPPAPRAEPFLSAHTLRAHPELAAPDRRPELVAALSLCTEQAVALRQATDATGAERPAGLFWAELARIADDGGESRPRAESRRHALRRFARLRQAADPEIVRAAERALSEGRPARLAAAKDAYTVTELELYLRCPYGWFVRHVLAPAGAPSSPAARRGQVAHSALEQLLRHPGADPHAAVRAAGADLPDLEAQVLGHQLERVMERYAPPAWPWEEHHVELEVASEDLIGGRRLFGRLDRVDVDTDTLVVIDYKLRRAPRLRRPDERALELQRYIYPQLASAHLERAPLGTLLVSIFHADHEGSVNAAREELLGPAVDLDFDDDAESALRIAEEAIERIEMGEWDEVGHACPAYCPHHAVSPTLPLVRGGA